MHFIYTLLERQETESINIIQIILVIYKKKYFYYTVYYTYNMYINI